MMKLARRNALWALAVAGVVGLAAPSPLAWSADPRSAGARPPFAPPANAPRAPSAKLAGEAPAVIAGYAALSDPTTGRRYVQRSGGAVAYTLSLQAVFRRDDGTPEYAEACSYMCGVGVDDRGAQQPVNSGTITAFGYVVVFHADRTLTYAPQGAPGHGSYRSAPITGVITYNPDHDAFVELRARIRVDDNYRGTHQDIVMSSRPPFEGLPDL
jgi:hypothetical protein